VSGGMVYLKDLASLGSASKEYKRHRTIAFISISSINYGLIIKYGGYEAS